MGRETRYEWARRVEEWGRSRLSGAEFAAEIGVKEATLRHWKWRLARGQERQPKEAAFVRVAAVKMPASAVGTKRIELVVSEGLRIRVWEGFDAATLRRVLDVVRER